MDDKLSSREKMVLLFSIGPWALVIAQAAVWVIDVSRFSWGMFLVWLLLLFVALFLTSAALPKVPRH